MNQVVSYRILQKGDVVQEGDEIKELNRDVWSPTCHFKGDSPAIVGVTPYCHVGHYRRKIPSTPDTDTMNPHPNDPKGQAGAAKTPLHLIPTVAMNAESQALKQGAEKYGLNNWRESGVNAMTYVGAMLRHLTAWRDGEDVDPDSGISHLGHIRANCAILLDAAHVGKLVDDRPVHRKKMSREDLCKALGVPWVKGQAFQPNPDYTDAPKEAIRVAIPEKAWQESGVPDGLPPLPPVPEGFDRWVYRGTGWHLPVGTTYLRTYATTSPTLWSIHYNSFPMGTASHYIEAVKD